jgi:hypothetical protein
MRPARGAGLAGSCIATVLLHRAPKVLDGTSKKLG